MIGAKITARVFFIAMTLFALSIVPEEVVFADNLDYRIEEWGAITSSLSHADSAQGEVMRRSAFVSVKPSNGQSDARCFLLMVAWSKKHNRAVFECFPCSKQQRWVGDKVRDSMAFYFDDIGGISCVVRDRTLFVCNQHFAAQNMGSAWETALRILAKAEDLDWGLSTQVTHRRLTAIPLRISNELKATFFPREAFGGPSVSAVTMEWIVLGIERDRVEGKINTIARANGRLVVVFAGAREENKKDELTVEVSSEGDLLRVLLNTREVPLSRGTRDEAQRWTYENAEEK